MRIELTTHVDAGIEDLWAIVSDIEGWPRILDSMDAVRITSDGDFGEGSTALVKQPQIPELTWTVTSWRPGEIFAWRARVAGTTIDATHRIQAEGEGTRFTLSLHQYGPTAPLMALLGGRRNRRYVGMELEGTKRAAELRARERQT